ncbi:MAG: geranylgeranylglycerol-phosphate geranylgeranyltransferase [Owenweeksia sp.]
MALLKLIRWPNLLMIALVQYLIRFVITESLGIPHVLNHLEYFYGVVCSISLAAGGYVVNDLYDLHVDEENKPGRVTIGKNFPDSVAWQIYFGLNILALFTGYLVAKAAGMPGLWMLPLIAIALLYFYSVDLKKRAVIGNVLVSLLTALPVALVALFDLIPAVTDQNREIVRSATEVVGAYALFAFWSNLIREMIKDAEDIKGDARQGYRTLAVLLGSGQMRYIIVILILVMLSFTGFYNVYLFSDDQISALYILLFVNLPLLYLILLVFKSKTAADFKKASTWSKVIMLTGILSMVVFTLSLKLQW